MLIQSGKPVGIYADFWVSPSGNDLWSGSASSPWLTPSHAASFVASLGRTQATIGLRGGSYYLPSALALTSLHNGINWVGNPGETPILSGGQVVPGWSLSSGSIYVASFAASLGKPRVLWDSLGNRYSRSSTTISTSGWAATSTGYTGTVPTYAKPSELEFVVNYQPQAGWFISRLGVTSISGSTITMPTTAYGNLKAWIGLLGYNSFPTTIENATEIFTANNAAGTFWQDTTNNLLYLIPAAGVTGAQITGGSVKIIAGLLNQVMTANGLQNSTIAGITFSHTTAPEPASTSGYVGIGGDSYWTGGAISSNAAFYLPNSGQKKTTAAVQLTGCDNIVFNNNTGIHLGTAGAAFDGAGNNLDIFANVFEDVSGEGVFIGDPTQQTHALTIHNVNFHSNVVHDVGKEFFDASGVHQYCGDNISISNNEVYNIPYHGISAGQAGGYNSVITSPGWLYGDANRNISINSNLVYNVVLRMNDGGGIYLNTNNAGSAVNGNYVYNVNPNAVGSFTPAYYLDDGASGITLTNNVAALVGGIWCCQINDNVGPNTFNGFITDWNGVVTNPYGNVNGTDTLMHVTQSSGSIWNAFWTANVYQNISQVRTAAAQAAGLALNAGLEPQFSGLKAA